ncbi:MAG: hypothetical protein ACRBBW_20525 [Cellvibrionaceae bacterium]
MSGVTNVPAVTDPHLRLFLQQVKNVLDQGRLGSGNTIKDELVSSGLGSVGADGSFTFDSEALGTVEATNPMADLSIPGAPSTFEITGTVNYAVLSWAGTDQNIVSLTQIYMAETDDFSAAKFVGSATGEVFGHKLPEQNKDYYFWIRFISYAGTPSALSSLSGTLGRTDAATADDLTVNTVTAAKALIGEGEVGNLLIGDTIQSENYVPGVSGWAIKK